MSLAAPVLITKLGVVNPDAGALNRPLLTALSLMTESREPQMP